MLARHRDGPHQVAVAQRRDDGAMLINRADRLRRRLVDGDHHRGAAEQVGEDAGQFGIAQRLDEMDMEGPGQPDRGGAIAAPRCGALLFEMGVELREQHLVDPENQQAEHAGLEHAMRLIDPPDIVERRSRHPRAAVGDHLQPSLGAEPVQHFPDALARHAEDRGQRCLGELGAGLQLALQQRAQDGLVHRLVLGGIGLPDSLRAHRHAS